MTNPHNPHHRFNGYTFHKSRTYKKHNTYLPLKMKLNQHKQEFLKQIKRQ